MSRDGATEAGPAKLFGGRGIGLAEGLEQPAELLLAHADPRIRDRYLHRRTIRFATFDPNRELTIMGEFAGIAENVEKALLHLGTIGTHAADPIGEKHLKRVAVPGHKGGNYRLHLVEKRRNVGLLDEHVHLAGLDL